MPCLSREEILTAPDLKLTLVEVPEWGGSVNVKVMSGSEREFYEETVSANRNHYRARLVAATACDDAGKLLFTLGDLVELGERSSVPLDRVFMAALKANAIGEAAIKEEAKNSEAVPT